MADYKKNPLIGSFRDPAPGASPHGGEEKTKEPSKVEAPVPMDKPGAKLWRKRLSPLYSLPSTEFPE